MNCEFYHDFVLDVVCSGEQSDIEPYIGKKQKQTSYNHVRTIFLLFGPYICPSLMFVWPLCLSNRNLNFMF